MLNFIKTILFIILIVHLKEVSAGDFSFKVKKISQKKKLGLAKNTSSVVLTKKMNLVYEKNKNKKCILKIKKVTKRNIIFNRKKCKYYKDIKIGSTVKYIYKTYEDINSFEFLVDTFDIKKHQITLILPQNSQIKSGMEFNLFSRDYNHCAVLVKKVASNIAYLDSSTCSFEYEIRKGLKLDLKSTLSIKKEKKVSQLKFKKSYLNLMFNLGYPYIKYSGTDDLIINKYGKKTNKTHIPIAADLIGLYFSLNKLLVGFTFNIIGDFYLDFSNFGNSFQIDQASYSISSIYFFKTIKKYKFFVRSDIGGAKFLSTQVVELTDSSSKNGFSFVLGPGFSYKLTDKSSILVSSLYSYKKMTTSKIHSGLLMLGFMY
ncbi:MAG: hypothetical protein HOJ35_11740 [Bdellovibrionales bacterium]|nr:hypothetical protein [Bdellovibrionales bacterium]